MLYWMYLIENAAMQERIEEQYFGGRIIFPPVFINNSIISLAFAVAIGVAGSVLWSTRGRQSRVERPAVASSFALIAVAMLYFGAISDLGYYIPYPAGLFRADTL